MSAHRPDVLVVGGGPAGATAARALALGGACVRVLDRAAFPRSKPCGGAISVRALTRFPWLHGALARIPTHWISRLHLESADDGCAVTLASDRPAALMIRRVEFDHLLLTLAAEAGAEVEQAEIVQAVRDGPVVVLHARGGRTFRAPLVVAADGVNSVVARRLGFRREWPRRAVALDMMEETPVGALSAVDPGTLWVSYGYEGTDGYAYVFPKRDHVNVGIGCLVSDYRARNGDRPYELQRRFVRSLTDRGVLRGASVRRHFTPFLIPVGGPIRRTAWGGVLLAGDAAGFVNGYTAEGIYYAMVTGELAAGAMLAGSPGSYERAWRREIGAELSDSVIVQRHLFARTSRIDAMVSGARARPDLAMLLVDYAMGRLPYRAARRRLLMRSPSLLMALAATRLLGSRVID